MNDGDLIQALRRMAPETGSLHCLGCGYEHGCSLHGCAVIRRAAERLEQLTVLEPTAPLTLEELRAMDGEPIWVKFPKCPEASGWMLVNANRHCVYNGLLGNCDFENCGKTWRAYRRKPKEGEGA